MSAQQRVLIVDESSDSRQVLRTALERRGTQIFEACRASQGLELVRAQQPDVIVLDLEDTDGIAGGITGEFGEAVRARQTPIVLLGTARCQAESLPTGEFVAKPYHYGPLIRKIEGLLARLG